MNKRGFMPVPGMVLWELAVILVLAFAGMWLGKFAASHLSFLNATYVGWGFFIIAFVLVHKFKIV